MSKKNTASMQEMRATAQRMIEDRLADKLPLEAFEKWLDYFEMTELKNDRVQYVYSGECDLAEFNENYRQVFYLEVCSVLGRMVTLDIKNAREETKKPKTAKTRQTTDAPKASRSGGRGKKAGLLCLSILLVCFALVLAVLVYSYVETRNFTETFYSVSSSKVSGRIRVIQISDLHESTYGTDNETLIGRVEKLDPDLILLTGDCINADARSYSSVVTLCGSLAEIAPTYYIYGNNETEKIYDNTMTLSALDKGYGFSDDNRNPAALLEAKDDLKTQLEAVGVTVLLNGYDTLQIGTNVIDVYGVLTSNPSAFWPYAGETYGEYLYENTDHLKLTAIHEPYALEELTDGEWGDLVLCGHTHGGVVKIPFVGRLYEKEHGLFPESQGYLVYGRYDVSGTPVIVSAGLDNSGGIRVNNPPEITVIDINRY